MVIGERQVGVVVKKFSSRALAPGHLTRAASGGSLTDGLLGVLLRREVENK